MLYQTKPIKLSKYKKLMETSEDKYTSYQI